MQVGHLAMLAGAGLSAGFVDAIAGGGGLITVPALFAAGIPPFLALGTNKFQSGVGTAMACVRYQRAGLIDWAALIPGLIFIASGAVIGVVLLHWIGAATLKVIVPFLMVAAIGYFLFSPRMTDAGSRARLTLRGYAPIAAAIGCYDGFFGPGTGSFLTASLVALAGLGLSRATGHTKALNLTSNVAGGVIFIAAGQIVWSAALLMGAANIAGAWIGSHFALRHGARVIRPLLVGVSILLTLRILLDPANPLLRQIRV